jgi:hypothetical protein
VKLVNETPARGRHAVAFLAENQEDEAALQGLFAIFTRHRVLDANLGQAAGDPWRTLRVEEKE